MAKQEEAIREVSSYVTKRKQYPVEVPEDAVDLFSTEKHPRYQ